MLQIVHVICSLFDNSFQGDQHQIIFNTTFDKVNQVDDRLFVCRFENFADVFCSLISMAFD